MPTLTLNEVHALASEAHEGQTDKIGVPYIRHVEAVAAGLAPFGERMQMAGLLHDIIEDTHWTAEHLIEAGVPAEVVAIVESVTNTPGELYQDKILKIVDSGRSAILVKIADNAHNSHPARTLPSEKVTPASEESRKRRAKKYRKAREALWSAVSRQDVETILWIVNPFLTSDLGAGCGAGGGVEEVRSAVNALREGNFGGAEFDSPGVAALARSRHALANLMEVEVATWTGDEVHYGCSAGTCTFGALVEVATVLLSAGPGNGDDEDARALAEHIANHRVSTIQAAFRLLGWKVGIDAVLAEGLDGSAVQSG